MKKVVVLGCGMVGKTMVKDLAKDKDLSIAVYDRDTGALEELKKTVSPAGENGIEIHAKDLSRPETVKECVKDADLVIGALPGFLGFQTLKAVIESGKNCADISFMPEDASALDGLAKEKGVTAVVDFGVAPGISNLIFGRYNHEFDVFEEGLILVGGLPRKRSWPYEYKAPFSSIDVIEEYTRPARYVRDGKVVVMPALSEPEFIEFPVIGTLEAFNTDGLRSLIKNIRCPNMKEKTLRYPGHIEKMRVLRETGFFSQEEIEVKGNKIRPIDLTSKLLFPLWRPEADEEEFTLMRVEVTGVKDGNREKHIFNLLDFTDFKNKDSSMARTTGFPNVIMAREILNGNFTRKGVFPPELVADDKNIYHRIFEGLKERGVNITHNVEICSK
ncbi:MAG: saccharopine dehydrogenase C-terminal domain-containing protein [Thermoplasmata archaeon]